MQAYLKAFTGAVIAGLLAAQIALEDNVLTWKEGVGVAVAFFTVLAGVWAVPNQQPKP